jgi:hypothetical protein
MRKHPEIGSIVLYKFSASDNVNPNVVGQQRAALVVNVGVVDGYGPGRHALELQVFTATGDCLAAHEVSTRGNVAEGDEPGQWSRLPDGI